jgi:hypothetical protein
VSKHSSWSFFPGTASKYSSDCFTGFGELSFEPSIEREIEQGSGHFVSADFEEGIDAGFDRELPQEIRAERMNGADSGLFQFRQRISEKPAFLLGVLFIHAGQPELQFTRGCVGESHRDDLIEPSFSAFDRGDHSAYQATGFSGSSGGFDYHCSVEVVTDSVPGLLIGELLVSTPLLHFVSHNPSMSDQSQVQVRAPLRCFARNLYNRLPFTNQWIGLLSSSSSGRTFRFGIAFER